MKKYSLWLLLAVNILITASFWWHFTGPLLSAGDLNSSLLAFGRLSGLLAANLLLIQLILIGRVKWVETVFGLDKLNVLHRLNGYTILCLILLHPFFITLSYSRINEVGYFSQLFTFITSWEDVWRAFLAYLMLIVTIGLSIYIIRRRLKYETWYYVHVFNYAAILLAFGHQLNTTPEAQSPWFVIYWYFLYIFAFGNLILFRFIFMYYQSYKHRFTVSRVVDEGVATSIYITGQKMDEFKVKAGQFMFFRFAQDGFRWQKHPFSSSMVPKNNEIRFTAKRLGDFTNALPTIKPGTLVTIDGPHGTFTEDSITKEKLLFIAGGSGITPIRSLLESLGPKQKDMVLLYSNKSRADIMLGKELEELSKSFGFKIINILADENADGYERGRLDQDTIKRLVPDISSREAFLCGPPPMTKAVRPALENLGIPKPLIHFEKFAL